MKQLLAIAFFAAAGTVCSQVLWYNGDLDGDGLASERNTQIADARAYDNFRTGTGWVLNRVWGNFLVTQDLTSTSLYYEIRRNVAVGNGGTLVASGSVASTRIATGRSAFNFQEVQHSAAIPSLALANNTEYWLTVAPIGNGAGRAAVSTTSGQDLGPGSDPNPAPIGFLLDGSFFDSDSLGYDWVRGSEVFGGDDTDFSLGVAGVPEPTSLVVLGVLLAGMAKRRRSR